jgi:predicted nucleotidyltransferase
MGGLSPSLKRTIIELLDRRFGLVGLWVFGSFASGQARSDSDLDLAALFEREPSALELLEARSALSALISRDVDLVNLESASPVLLMQVLRHGTLLLDRNPARRIRLTASAPGRYEDLSIVRREVEQALLGRIRGRS